MTIILGYSCLFLSFLAPAHCEIVADDEKMHTRTIIGSFVSTKFVLSCMPLFISLSMAWFVIRVCYSNYSKPPTVPAAMMRNVIHPSVEH